MKRGMIIAIAAGAVVLVLLWYFLLFAPTSSDLSETRDEVAEAQRQKQELENTVRRLKELSRNSVQQTADLQALRAAIPELPDLGEFILQANEIASASGIDWLSISPSPPVAGTRGPNSTIALSIQVNGGFFELLDYLNRLEDLERLVIIDAVSVSTSDSDTGNQSNSGADDSVATFDAGTGAPALSVTLTGRMFTNAEAAPVDGSTGGTTTPTPTPTAPAPSSSSSSGDS
jgi:Tfp pilus assembly protein PilO